MIPRMFVKRKNCCFCYLFLLFLAVKVTHVPALSCFKDEFTCADGSSCLHQRFVCDLENDCNDGSDESNCPIRTCLQTEHKCGNGRCISQSWKCDQYADCTDNSDEHNCNTTCSADKFPCDNGYCLPSQLLCDGDKDCNAGEDEKDCTNKTTCSSGFFQCKSNNSCIDKSYLCDGDDDCGDNSDEKNCGNICKPGTFTCKSGSCISGNLRCNGKQDCTDGSDEDQCPQGISPKCFKDEFKCSNGECILKAFECDGEKDCTDGTDEHCGITSCPLRHDRCDNKKCIMKYLFCDGKDDCGDRSDEKNERCVKTTSAVTTKGLTCKADEYKCKSLKCINKTKVCDQHNDCPDNDDESSCSNNGCKNNNGGCSQLCNDTGGFYCSCKPGYKLKNDFKTCEDIDECKIPGKCAQRCKNKPGSFKCWCIEGYQLAPDGKRCFAKGTVPYLLVAVGMDIRNISTDGSRLKCVVRKNVKDVVAVAVHYKKKVIFWSDLYLETIFMAPIGGKGKDAKVLAKSRSPRGLSVDWVAEKLYWINVLSEGSRIEVAELDGSHHKVLIPNIKGEAHSIVVDPVRGYIYWTNPSIPSISRAHMDGHNTEVIVKTNLRSPTGLTIDVTIEKLYWLDSKTHSIESSDLNGNNRHSVVTHNVKSPFAIAVFEDRLYWTESVSKTVISVNKFTGDDRRVLIAHENISSYIPKGILIDHPLTQPDVPNNCKKNRDCSHLCLLNPKGYRCVCPNNGVLSTDKKTCNMPQDKNRTANPTQLASSLTTKGLVASSSTTKGFDNPPTKKPGTKKRGSGSQGLNVILIAAISSSLIILLSLVVLFFFYRKRNNSRKMEIRYNTQLGDVDIRPSDAKNPTQGKKDVANRDTYIKFANKNFKDFDADVDDDDDDDDDNNYGEKQPVLKRGDGHVTTELV